MANSENTGSPAPAVNDQITDAVTQANTKVLAEAPAMAMGNLILSTSQALGTAAHNATLAQQQANLTLQAATLQGVNALMGTGAAFTAKDVEPILEKG